MKQIVLYSLILLVPGFILKKGFQIFLCLVLSRVSQASWTRANEKNG